MLNVCVAVRLLCLVLFMPAHMRIIAYLVLHFTWHTLTVAQKGYFEMLVSTFHDRRR